jgi:hypothetical protein
MLLFQTRLETHGKVTITWRMLRMKLPRRRPRYADIVATLALFFALGGTAYAVTQIDPDSVYTDAIQDKAVTVAKLHNNSVDSTKVVNGSITSLDITDNSLGAADLATSSVDNSELATNAVTGAKVADNSIGLADLVGANVNGSISFSLGANTCATLNFGVGGAQVGDVVLMSYTGTVAMPPGVVFAPFRVVSAGSITTRACNVTASSMSVSSIGVHFVTFG